MSDPTEHIAPNSISFLNWGELVERARQQDPVWVSVAGEEGLQERGCFPELRSGKIYLGKRLCLSRKGVGEKLLSRVVCTNGRLVSVKDGRLVSRVILRSCRRLQEANDLTPEITLMQTLVGKCRWLALLVDEPVDPSGCRCLFSTDKGQMGGADLDWVLKNTSNYFEEGNHTLILETLSSMFSHLKEFALCSALPKNSEAVRKRKAGSAWMEWHRKELDYCANRKKRPSVRKEA